MAGSDDIPTPWLSIVGIGEDGIEGLSAMARATEDDGSRLHRFARHLALAMQSLTMFPSAFPQLTRHLMGRTIDDPKFQRAHAAFLEKFAAAFRPMNARTVKINFAK